MAVRDRPLLASGDSVYTCDIDRTALDAAALELPGLKTGLSDAAKSISGQIMPIDGDMQRN
jgi:hypothetical protein